MSHPAQSTRSAQFPVQMIVEVSRIRVADAEKQERV